MAISEDDLRGLSVAEREALLSTAEDDEDLLRELGGVTAPAPKPKDGDEGDGGDDGEGGDPAGAPGPAPAPPAGAPVAEPPAATPAPAAAPVAAAAGEAAFTPAATQQVAPADAGEQRKALRLERSEARRQYADGEIGADALDAVETRVDDALDTLIRAEATDQVRGQLQQDAMVSDFNTSVRDAHKALAAAGLDLAANDGAVIKELGMLLPAFAQLAANNGLTDAPGNIAASRAAIADAQAFLLLKHGKQAAAPAATPAPTPAPRKPAPPDRSQFPPTLANVPAAADATISNEFGHLDTLEGSALERALAKLSPEQQDRYLG